MEEGHEHGRWGPGHAHSLIPSNAKAAMKYTAALVLVIALLAALLAAEAPHVGWVGEQGSTRLRGLMQLVTGRR